MKHEAAGVASPLDVQLPSNQRPMRKDDRDEALHGGGDGGGGAARDGGHGRRSRLLYGWSGSVVAAILLVLPLTCGNYAGVMSGGYYHTCAITTDGDARCWGDDVSNQSRVPKEYARFQIHSNKSSTNGSWSLLFDWSKDDQNGTLFNFSDPDLGFEVVGGDITWQNITGWRSISAGYSHSCGLTEKGVAFCWGQGKNLQSLLPQWIMGSDDLEWKHISCGTGHTCGILLNGSAFCWGANDEGQSMVPEWIDSWRQIDAGYAHTCAVASNGSAYCWGWNGVTSGSLIPFGQATPPKLPSGMTWARVSAGFVHSCGVTNNGTGYCWGKNDNGQTDIPQYMEVSTSNVPGSGELVAIQWKYIDVSYFHSCGITVNGTVLCWGNNDAGQSTVPSFTGFNLVMVTSGFVHNCVLNSTGTPICWGPTPHGSKAYWFLGQTVPPANISIAQPSDDSGDFVVSR